MRHLIVKDLRTLGPSQGEIGACFPPVPGDSWPEDVSLQQNSEKHPDLCLRAVGPPHPFWILKEPRRTDGSVKT